MANYAITNSTNITFGSSKGAMTTTFRTIARVGVGSSVSGSGFPSGGAVSPYNPRRGKIYDLLIGTDSTPGDTAVLWDMARATTMLSSEVYIGALTSASSVYALDMADGLLSAFAIVNSTAETATYGNEAWSVGINQRASYRWVAAPGSEFVYPATSSAGLGLRAMGPSGGGSFTGTVTATVLFQEQ